MSVQLCLHVTNYQMSFHQSRSYSSHPVFITKHELSYENACRACLTISNHLSADLTIVSRHTGVLRCTWHTSLYGVTINYAKVQSTACSMSNDLWNTVSPIQDCFKNKIQSRHPFTQVTDSQVPNDLSKDKHITDQIRVEEQTLYYMF